MSPVCEVAKRRLETLEKTSPRTPAAKAAVISPGPTPTTPATTERAPSTKARFDETGTSCFHDRLQMNLLGDQTGQEA